MDKFLPVALLIVLYIGCSPKKHDSQSAYFAGEIVNPTNDYVVLYKGSQVIDSSRLDGRNRFSFHLDSLCEGLYHFNHAPEYQYVYLEKGDSLMVRLNTTDFDESLVFSGTNEAVNNFLLELFLANEEEETAMYTKFFDLEPSEFSQKIDELQKEKTTLLKEIQKETALSSNAFDMAKASIDYNYYRYLEIYPFEHKRKRKENILHKLPSDFYGYRKNINYNDENLSYLRPYYDFLKSHFGNIAYMACSKDCGLEGKPIKNHLHFNEHKLKIIDSLVITKELRDNLFRNVAIDYLLKEYDSPKNSEIFINAFRKVSGNNIHKDEIDALYQSIINIQPENPVPDVDLVSFDDRHISLPEVAKNKRALFYFWSANNKQHYQHIFQRVAELERNNMNYTLVGINVKTETNNWKGLVQSLGLDPSRQFRADNFEEVQSKLILHPMNKCILTDNAMIVDAFSNIYGNLSLH